MSESHPDIKPKQEQAIIALLNEPTIQKAALAAKVDDRTIYRWMKESVFLAALRKARRDSFSQAIAMSQRYASLAVNTLAKIASDATAPHSARVSASGTLLKFGRECLELEDLAARVDVLEQAAKQDGNSQGRHHAA